MFWKKPWIAGALYALALAAFTAYVLLDTFVIPKVYTPLPPAETVSAADTAQTTAPSAASSDAASTDTPAADAPSAVPETAAPAAVGPLSERLTDADGRPLPTPLFTDTVQQTDTAYSDSRIAIALFSCREENTTVHVADIRLTDPAFLKTALAKDAFGANLRAFTSATAKAHNALLAINGDYYGARVGDGGYVLRNGVLYQEKAMTSRVTGTLDDLVIWKDGGFSIINEQEVPASALLEQGAMHLLAFGPALLRDGELAVSPESLTGLSKARNPRTAIGIVEPGRYVFAVVEGRTAENPGMSVYSLAVFLQKLGVTTAYNLDGGGSSTLYFNGNVVNHPTTDGQAFGERSVSDIVYIGY